MDYSHFPQPYDEVVPRRIAEVRENLSPLGVDVLEDLIAEANDPGGELILAMRIGALPESEGEALMGLVRLLGAAHTAAADAAV